MKILIVSERFHPEVGAAPSRLTNMAEGFQARGADVDVLTCLPNYPKGRILEGYRHRVSCRDNIYGCNVFRYWIYATVSKSPVKRALNMISFALTLWLFAVKVRRCRSYDVVIIQTPTLLVAVSAMKLFKGLYGRKCVLNVSDIWPSTAVDMGAMKEGSRAYKVMAWCEKYLYRKSDGILGLSGEILEHISHFDSPKNVFLYRNLQRYDIMEGRKAAHKPFRIAFAGMLGVAQDVLSIVKNVDFAGLGVEFHIIGGGGQFDAIKEYVDGHPGCNVVLHGFVPKERMASEYANVDAAIVPLAVRIYGAFPSKIFDILPMGLPILFCGEGEAASFILEHGVGYVSKPGDYEGLTKNVRRISILAAEDYQAMSSACVATARNELNFDTQMDACVKYIMSSHFQTGS